MVKKLSKKDSKKLKVVIHDDEIKEEEPEVAVNEERKDLSDEIEEEDLENIISERDNSGDIANFRRFKLRDINPSLQQEDVNLEQSIADIPININRANEDTNNRNLNNQTNTYLSTPNAENQTNPYSPNANLYGPDNNTNIQNAYQEIVRTANITSLEQQRLNQTSINTPQRLNPNPQNSEIQKSDDPWGFHSQDKNIINLDEAKKKEKERRFYQ